MCSWELTSASPSNRPRSARLYCAPLLSSYFLSSRPRAPATVYHFFLLVSYSLSALRPCRRFLSSPQKEDERRSLFEDLVGEDQRDETLDYRRRYQTWRRKGMAGAKGEFSDKVVFHFDAYNPPQPAATAAGAASSAPANATVTVTLGELAKAPANPEPPASASAGDCKMAPIQTPTGFKKGSALPSSAVESSQEEPGPNSATAIWGPPSSCCF